MAVPFDYAGGDGVDFEPFAAFLSAEETTDWFQACGRRTAAIAATGIGAPLVAVLEPALAAVVPVLANAVNRLLGTGDDPLGTLAVPVSVKQLCTLAGAGPRAEQDIRYHIASPLISDGDAS
jgi:hypothetical protein